jgi:hypothetical protein
MCGLPSLLRRHERAARGDRRVSALRRHAHAALRLDASVRAASTGTNSLQQKLLGLATGQDHRAASTRHVVSVPCLSPARHP